MGRMKNKIRTWTEEQRIKEGKKMYELRTEGILYGNIAVQYGCSINSVTAMIRLYLLTIHSEEETNAIIKKLKKRGSVL